MKHHTLTWLLGKIHIELSAQSPEEVCGWVDERVRYRL